jgi:hypothetical protein
MKILKTVRKIFKPRGGAQKHRTKRRKMIVLEK